MDTKIYNKQELTDCDLVVDAIYEGGNAGNAGDDPISKILKVGNQGGFRYLGYVDALKYIVLYTSGENIDWPDSIDTETGIFKYYGDNRKPGHDLHTTSRKGNVILKNLFDCLYSTPNQRIKIPPIFIFEKHPTAASSRSVQFKGLCVPGTIQRDAIDNLVAIWKTTDNLRFQNYVAYFTILDMARIPRQWIRDLEENNALSENSPGAFAKWVKSGVYSPLVSQKTVSIRTLQDQRPKTASEEALLETIFNYFEPNPTLFEFFAADIFKMTNSNIIIDEITRGVVDGGRDALGRLKMGLDADPIFAEFALEAKCYNPGLQNGESNTVGVKETSRLISRIRNRQFGVLVTTSQISKQAYEEVRSDKHPIIFISGGDITKILIEKGINTIELLISHLTENYIHSTRMVD